MSINNLSSGFNGPNQLNARPAFLRDDVPPALISTVERYSSQPTAGGGQNGTGNGLLFDGGESKVDFRAIAQALLARLNALRDRYESKSPQDQDAQAYRAKLGVERPLLYKKDGTNQGWWHNNTWYATGNAPAPSGVEGGGSATTTPESPPAPTATASPSSATSQPPVASTGTNNNPSSATTPASSTATPSTSLPMILGGVSVSNSMTLGNGATTIANTVISGDTGIVADNATHVTTLNVSNVVIHSTNYGIYLGDADTVNLTNVDITADPNGGDSYSVRGNIKHLTTSDSVFRSGIKAFRIYGLEGGSSTRDTYVGDRLMLGGGYSNEWGSAGPFHNFTFTDATIEVNSIELYNDTNNVAFKNVDFTGTGHISIQYGAHDITFADSRNLPLIKYYDSAGNRYYPSAAELAARHIVIA